MRVSRWTMLVALAGLVLLAWRLESCLKAQPDASKETEVSPVPQCFTATSDHLDEHSAAMQVFTAAQRSGNGETWYAILRAELDQCAKVLGPIPESAFADAPTTGEHFEVRYRALRSWVAFDAEAGGVVVCASDASLLQHLRSTYERACHDPAYLNALIAAVPDDSWND